MAQSDVDKRDGPFDWGNYQTVSIDVYRMKGNHEYALIYRIKPHILSDKYIITNSMVLKLKYRDLKEYQKFTIKKYYSDFSKFLMDN